MTAPSPAKRQPLPFGKYLLLDRINIGGMAEVWRGKMFGAGNVDRLVAIKRILPNIAEDEEFIRMFIDEAKISVQLTHANIAQIYELGHVSQSYFIAMEYIAGRDLRAIFDRSRRRGEPAPIPFVAYCVLKICEALDYAHRKKDGMGRELNIVHRDVSPQNIILSYEGDLKVIDFGIAKAAGKATKTQAGILKGKFGYMSPEQIRGLPVDRRSDIFAIGVVLYEMLTAERLFVGESDFNVLEKVRKAEVAPPSSINKLIPEALDRIVLKALAKDVEARYQFSSEVAEDLQRFMLESSIVFGRKELTHYMKTTFAEDVERERVRIQEYADLVAPEPPPVEQELPTTIPVTALSLGNGHAVPLGPAPVHGSALPKPAGGLPPRPSAVSVPALTQLPEVADGHREQAVLSGKLQNEVSITDPDFVPAPKARPTPNPSPAPSVPMLPDVESIRTVPARGLREPAVPQKRTPSTGLKERPVPPPLPPEPPSDMMQTIAAVPPPAVRARLDEIKGQQAAAAQARWPLLEEEEEVSTLLSLARQKWRLLVMVGGVLLAVLSSIIFWPRPMGYLLIEPVGRNISARVVIGSEDLGLVEKGQWPLMHKVPAGPIAVMIAAEGYTAYSRGIVVTEGAEPTRFAFQLEPVSQRVPLVVVTDPEDAEILIDGQLVRALGTRTVYVGDAPVGRPVTVEVRVPGRSPYIQKVVADPPGPAQVIAHVGSNASNGP